MVYVPSAEYRVGPHGYIHGWIFVGAPGVGAHVFHPRHGAGVVTAHNGAQATIRFHKSGAVHTFSARERTGGSRLEPADVREVIAHSRHRVEQVTERLNHHADKSVDPGMRSILSRMHDELGKPRPDVAKLKAELDEFDQLLLRPRRGNGPHRDAHLLSFYRDLADSIDGIDYLRKTPPSQRTAETPIASTVHEPVGNPAGPGLWHHKGMQLPAYIQHVANRLRAQGHPESQAVHMAVGIVQNWAAGHDGHGNSVHPDVQTAAAKAVAEWEALKAAAHASGGKGRAHRLPPEYRFRPGCWG